MGYWLGLLALPGTPIPALDQTRQILMCTCKYKIRKRHSESFTCIFISLCLRAPKGMIYLRQYFIPQDYLLSSLQRLQRWQLWCWLLRCTYTVHWHCTKMISRLLTWVTVSWGHISVSIILSCVQVIHMEIKTFISCYQFFKSSAAPSYWINYNWLGMSSGLLGVCVLVGFFGFLFPLSL